MSSTLRTFRRPSSRRVFWASSLAALSLAGLYASARAAEQLVVAAPDGCDTGTVEWSYEIALDEQAGYVITGTRFGDVPDACDGARVQILYRSDGAVVHTSDAVLHDGTTDTVDAGLLTTVRITDAAWLVLPG